MMENQKLTDAELRARRIARCARWRKANPEKMAAAAARWKMANAERNKATEKKRKKDNREQISATYAKWYAENKEAKKASHALWLKANKGRVAETAARRRAVNREIKQAEAAARRATAPPSVERQKPPTWRQANPIERFYKGSQKLRDSNRKATRAYRQRNIEARRLADREHAKARRARNPEAHKEWVNKNREYVSAHTREWRKTANVVRRRCGDGRTAKNTPAWANQLFIKEIYAMARLRTKVMGLPWEVDHEIPLNGKTVCGLHVENNLCVVERRQNRTKGNAHAC